jgi:hypothetical protein
MKPLLTLKMNERPIPIETLCGLLQEATARPDGMTRVGSFLLLADGFDVEIVELTAEDDEIEIVKCRDGVRHMRQSL